MGELYILGVNNLPGGAVFELLECQIPTFSLLIL